MTTTAISRGASDGVECGHADAETSVLANELKDDGFCFLALSPGWVNTDMGGDNARKLGMKGAPLDIDTSIKLQLQVLKSLTTQNNGEFLDQEGKTIEW